MDKKIFGNNLQLVRINRGYSQEQAAELCGISEKTLGKIERAQANFSVETINKIEEGMSLSIAELIDGNICLDSNPTVWEYYPILETIDDPDILSSNDIESKYTYGIMVCKNTAAGMYLISIVHDVSTDPDYVFKLVFQFNSYQLSPVQLFDVVLDLLP